MARRYCGDVRLYLEYMYNECQYKVRLVTDEGRHTVYVREPAYLEHGVDSPEAFDAAAHAALSFASHDYFSDKDNGVDVDHHADFNDEGYAISRRPLSNRIPWFTALYAEAKIVD